MYLYAIPSCFCMVFYYMKIAHFFIQSNVDGHLWSVQYLDIWKYYSKHYYTFFDEVIYTFLLDICLEVEILGNTVGILYCHRVHICSTVLVSAKQFSKVVALMCTPTSCVGDLLLPHIFATVLYHLIFVIAFLLGG